jgi:hypothetical protein
VSIGQRLIGFTYECSVEMRNIRDAPDKSADKDPGRHCERYCEEEPTYQSPASTWLLVLCRADIEMGQYGDRLTRIWLLHIWRIGGW